MTDIDVTSHLDAVRREVGTRAVEPGQPRVVTLTRRYDATVEEVWDACTNPDRIPRWFLPVSGELRAGGRYQLEGNAGGTVERCEPPTGFTATWEYGGNVSRIELRLSPSPDGPPGGAARTLLRLAHVAPDDEEHWARFGPGAVGIGWELGLLGLALHLAAPDGTVDQAGVTGWLGSPAGRRFVARLSDRWCEANVAGGEDPATARAMADRTTAAYTGTEGADGGGAGAGEGDEGDENGGTAPATGRD